MKLRAALLACLVAATPPKPTLDDCDAQARDHPKDLPSYLCYWLAARRLQAWDDAARRLDAKLAIDPSNHLAQLYLGLIEADVRHDRAKELLDRAADGLVAEKSWTGAVYATLSLAYYHQIRGNLPEADKALARAQAAADASGDPMLLARLDFEQARQAYLKADFGRAWAFISKAETEVTPEAPFDLRTGVLSTLGAVTWALGRYRDSLNYYEKQAAIFHDAGNAYLEAHALYNMAVLADTLKAADGVSPQEGHALAKRAFDTAVAAGNVETANEARLLLAEDPSLDLSARIGLLDTVLRTDPDPTNDCEALRLLALLTFRADPGRPDAAIGFADRAIAAARDHGEPQEIAVGCVAKMNLRWETGPEEAAIADSLAALEAVEKIRDLQRDELVGARWFAGQAVHYYQASGRILESANGRGSPERLELAFSIAERMRARALLDSLDAAHVTSVHAQGGPRAVERDALLERIAQTQKQLVQGTRSADEKASLLREIEKLESREAALRDEMARANPRVAALRRPAIPTLAEIRSLLAPDEALLAFQLSTRRVDEIYTWPNGGSWVFVVTRESAKVFPLPESDVLEKEIDVWIGTFPRRDGLERTGAERLYDDLVKDALASLPAGIRRLVVVPDRELHRLPFDALAESEESEPLGSRFEISIVPSATIWARWRSQKSEAKEGALALADPAMPSDRAPALLRQAAPWVEGLRLGPLPQARSEAHRLARLLGERCRLREGALASEHWLKHASLADYGVIVLATHAVLDEQRPERSAVLLAPGSEKEDGLLQPREIADLSLDGRLVVLSSCSSASGTVLRGEGVVGLAHAFFEAGARAVVASLWPMRDEEAAAVAGDFYRHLSRGESVGHALAGARRDRRKAGAPAAEWAGLVVLGDGDLVPFPGGVRPTSVRTVTVAIALVSALALAAALVFGRHRLSSI